MTLVEAITLLRSWMVSVVAQWAAARTALISLRNSMRAASEFLSPYAETPEDDERGLGGSIPMLIPTSSGWRVRYGSLAFDGASIQAAVTAAQSTVTADIAALTAAVNRLRALATKASA